MDSDRVNQEKAQQLGMPIGTAANRLRKQVMFSLVQETQKDTCFRCGLPILAAEDLSIEHIKPWLHDSDPKKVFFDLKNITFSHLGCNVGSRRGNRKVKPCGTVAAYNRGCRCDDCREARRQYRAKVG